MSFVSARPIKLALAGAFLATATMSSAFAASYTIDPSHSFIQFSTGHLGFSKLVGRFNKFSGTMTYDPAAGPAAQKVSIQIDPSSLDTNWADRDKHLRGSDFFDVDKNTAITFESTGFDGTEAGGTLTGNLTFMGITKEISFPVTKIGEGTDPWGGYRIGFEGAYTLTRADFGMNYNLGPSAEKVEVALMIEAIKDK
ncbi:MAG: YceI family protein [Pseudomonadota bacterium]